MELDLQVVLGFGDPANLIDEVHVPRGAPVLAISDTLQADIFLHPDDGADGRILYVAPGLGGNLAARVVVAGLQDLGSPEQAADVIGPKRRKAVHAEMSRSANQASRFNHNCAATASTFRGLACRVVPWYGSQSQKRPPLNHRGVSLESQTLRALLEMRELILRGAFRPGERLREVPLAARLNVSRTPLRLVLDRLAQEGLLKARKTGGFVASEFTVEDIRDAIEIRGVLEGAAARLAAERPKDPEDVAELRRCVAALDALVRQTPNNIEFFATYIDLNGQFHAHILEMAKSAMLSRSMEHVLTLPFASPNAFFLAETETEEGRETIVLSQAHHRAIANAIIDGEGARAEALAREHSRLARTNLEASLKERTLTRIPGASLIKFPEAI